MLNLIQLRLAALFLIMNAGRAVCQISDYTGTIQTEHAVGQYFNACMRRTVSMKGSSKVEDAASRCNCESKLSISCHYSRNVCSLRATSQADMNNRHTYPETI